jgi:hypothetical protein
MISGLSLVDLEEWENDEEKRGAEAVNSLLEKLEKGEKISFLDFAPEYKNILRDKTYGPWFPTGDPQFISFSPLSNLANVLDKGKPVPSVILVPLDICRSKATFKVVYGLVPDKGGLSYDTFLQEIREGRILPILISDPTLYKADFYQEILRACEQGEIQQPPPFLPARVSLFMEKLSLSISAIQEGIPPEEGWEDLVLQKHPEYDFESWLEKVMSIFSDEVMRVIQEVDRARTLNEEIAILSVANSAQTLSVFGFSGLANLSLELLRKDPLIGYMALMAYERYLISGYSMGLGGLMMYDIVDLEAMTFFRIFKKRGLLSRFLGAIKKDGRGAPSLEEETVILSPAGFSVVGSAVELPIVARFDVDDLRSSLKRERDKELERNMLEAMRAFQSYDFAKFREKSEVINEVIAEGIAKETRSYYRRSKIVEGSFVAGGTLTLAAGAIAVYQYLQPLLSLYSVFAGKAFDFMIKKREDVAKWLVSSWPFQQKGLPFYLWIHNIKPDKIQKALNA